MALVSRRPPWTARPLVAGWLLASAALGAVDATLALWHNRAIAPHATLPLCLTAPFAVALLVLAPPALLLAALPRRLRCTTPAALAPLLGLVLAAALLRCAEVVAAGWRSAGEARAALAFGVAAWPVAALAGAAVLRPLRRTLEGVAAWRLARCSLVAALLHVVAVAGAVAVMQREDRGALREALLWSLGLGYGAAAAASDAAPVRPAGGAPAGSANGPVTPRHLVLLTIDTLRADQLDPERMPHASALAAGGVRFREAYAAAPWTLPAVASLLTGLPAARHGAGLPLGDGPLSRSPLPPRHATIATRLAAAGFETRAIVTNPYLGLGYGLGRGFASFENVTLESEAGLTLRPTLGFWLLTRAVPALLVADRGDAVTARAARFLAARRDQRRLFLWLHYVDPHAPYDGATRSFRDDLLAGPDGALPRMAQLRAGEIRPDTAGRAALRDAYARAVRAVDREVGAVAVLLERRGLARDTLLVVTADHGEELWEHGGVEHGHTLYDELIRVPLVIRCPGCARAGAEVTAPVGIDGVAATVLELLGVSGSPDVPGEGQPMVPGFVAAVRGEPFRERPVTSENLLFAEERVALRSGGFTYVAWPNGKEELYDRRTDPGELHDVSARSELVRRHREQLATVRGAAPPLPRDGARPPRVARDVERALRALGYVE